MADGFQVVSHPLGWIASWLLAMIPAAASGLAGEGCFLERKLSQRAVLTNLPIQVTVTFTNNAAEALRGFYYADQIPSSLQVESLGVQLNGEAVTNFVFETGKDGDVYPNCTPYRWRLETPPGFGETNPIPAGAGLQIVYSLTSAATGTFNLQAFEWAACKPDKTNVLFGAAEPFEARGAKFVSSTNNPLVNATFSQSNTVFWLDGLPGSIYVLEVSSNLWHWAPLLTNLSPYAYTHPTLKPAEFFRGILYTSNRADLSLAFTPTNTLAVQVNGVAGCFYLLERSTDLAVWMPLMTNVSPFVFVDSEPGASLNTYRATLLSQ